MNIPELLTPLILAAAVAGIISLFFFLVVIKKTKTTIKREYDEKLEAWKLASREEVTIFLEQFKTDIITENDRDLARFKENLNAELQQDHEAFKLRLRKTNDFELQVLKSKIKNIQPSYPKKIEAHQKLAVLVNSLIPSIGIVEEEVEAVGKNFGKGEEQISRFIMDYAGIIDTKTEDILSHCASYCAEGKSEYREDGSLTNRGYELVGMLIEKLSDAKRQMKKENAFM